jgi:hypothetical protein
MIIYGIEQWKRIYGSVKSPAILPLLNESFPESPIPIAPSPMSVNSSFMPSTPSHISTDYPNDTFNITTPRSVETPSREPQIPSIQPRIDWNDDDNNDEDLDDGFEDDDEEYFNNYDSLVADQEHDLNEEAPEDPWQLYQQYLYIDRFNRVEDILKNITQLTWTPNSSMPDAPDMYKGTTVIRNEALRLATCVEDIFFFLLPLSFLEEVLEWTNAYKNQHAKGRKIKDFTLSELIHWHGLAIIHAIHPWKTGIRKNWRRVVDAPMQPGTFGRYMARDRFIAISSYLHFVNPQLQPIGDKMFKLRPVIDHLNHVFGSAVELGAQCSFDEGKIASKSKYLPAKTYDPMKPKKWGLKLFMLCCARTSFCTKFEVYGNDKAGPEALLRNVRHLEGSKRVIYCDRYYTSIALFASLLSLGIYAVGTCMRTRQGFPNSVKMDEDDSIVRGTIYQAYLDMGDLGRVSFLYYKIILID